MAGGHLRHRHGLGFDLLRHMSPDTLRPLLRVYFDLGRWDYSRRLGASTGPLHHMSPDTLRPLLRVYFDLGCWGYSRRLGASTGLPITSLLLLPRVSAQNGSGFERGSRVVKSLCPGLPTAHCCSVPATAARRSHRRCSRPQRAVWRGFQEQHGHVIVKSLGTFVAPSLKQERVFLGDSFPWSSSKQHIILSRKTGFRRIRAPFASSRGHVDRIKWHQRPLGNYERAAAVVGGCTERCTEHVYCSMKRDTIQRCVFGSHRFSCALSTSFFRTPMG